MVLCDVFSLLPPISPVVFDRLTAGGTSPTCGRSERPRAVEGARACPVPFQGGNGGRCRGAFSEDWGLLVDPERTRDGQAVQLRQRPRGAGGCGCRRRGEYLLKHCCGVLFCCSVTLVFVRFLSDCCSGVLTAVDCSTASYMLLYFVLSYRSFVGCFLPWSNFVSFSFSSCRRNRNRNSGLF